MHESMQQGNEERVWRVVGRVALIFTHTHIQYKGERFMEMLRFTITKIYTDSH